jgi:hypothetical protein
MLLHWDFSQHVVLPSLICFNTILHHVTTLRFLTKCSFTFINLLQYNSTSCYYTEICHNWDFSQNEVLPSLICFNTILHHVTTLRFLTTWSFTFINLLQYNSTSCLHSQLRFLTKWSFTFINLLQYNSTSCYYTEISHKMKFYLH